MKTIKQINEAFDYNFVVYPRSKINSKLDRDEFCSEINLPKKVKDFYTQQILSLIEELEGKVIGEDEVYIEKRTKQLNEKINRDLRGVLNDKIGARNIFRAEMRASIKELKEKL